MCRHRVVLGLTFKTHTTVEGLQILSFHDKTADWDFVPNLYSWVPKSREGIVRANHLHEKIGVTDTIMKEHFDICLSRRQDRMWKVQQHIVAYHVCRDWDGPGSMLPGYGVVDIVSRDIRIKRRTCFPVRIVHTESIWSFSYKKITDARGDWLKF